METKKITNINNKNVRTKDYVTVVLSNGLTARLDAANWEERLEEIENRIKQREEMQNKNPG